MDLFFSTSKFKLNGQSYAGFPVLITEDGKVAGEALDFCITHLIKRGRVESKKSWETYGKALYQFFGWCEANAKISGDLACETPALEVVHDLVSLGMLPQRVLIELARVLQRFV